MTHQSETLSFLDSLESSIAAFRVQVEAWEDCEPPPPPPTLNEDWSAFDKSTELGTGLFCTDTVYSGGILAAVMSLSGPITLRKSIDSGATWQTVSSPWSSGRTHPYIDANGSDVYIAAKGSGGIYLKKSTDSGASWESEIIIATGTFYDPKILRLASGTLLCAASFDNGVKVYRSVNDGASWGLVHTLSEAYHCEDTDAIETPSSILVAWELEQSEGGQASCRQIRSSDDGLTWSAQETIVDNAGFDDEGGTYCLDGAILKYIYGSDAPQGGSYDKNRIWSITSSDYGITWGSPSLLHDWPSVVEPVGELSGGEFILLGTRHYHTSESSSLLMLTSQACGFLAEDRGWKVDGGIAYVVDEGLRVDSIPHSVGRGFVVHSEAVADGTFKARAKVGPSNTSKDIRIVFRYQDTNNHYLLVIGGGSNQVNLYRRINGSYASLGSVSFTVNIGQWYDIEVVMNGSSFTCKVDGITKLSKNDSTYPSGKVGLASGGNFNSLPVYFKSAEII